MFYRFTLSNKSNLISWCGFGRLGHSLLDRDSGLSSCFTAVADFSFVAGCLFIETLLTCFWGQTLEAMPVGKEGLQVKRC